VRKIRLPAEIPLLPPHVIERDEANFSLKSRPLFFGKELGHRYCDATKCVAGIPRVAQAIAEIPTEHRAKALGAAERSYRQTVQELGYEEGPVQSWVSAVMLRLQTEVRNQESTKQDMLEALQEELLQAATEVDSNVVPCGLPCCFSYAAQRHD